MQASENSQIKPNLRRRGIGKRIINRLIKLHPLKEEQYWIAYVGEKNPKVKLFFESNGWKCVTQPPENNNMYLFEYGRN